MKGLPFVLLFTAMTFVAWGAYGPVLHHGANGLNHDSMRAFVGVGLAYFLIAVIIPILILRSAGETGKWTISGVVYSLVAGAVGALGALGIILALGYGGQTLYVMPLVFGFAPVVNTLVTALLSRTFNQISPLFIGGILTAALGAGGVLYFKPAPAKPAAVHTEEPQSRREASPRGRNESEDRGPFESDGSTDSDKSTTATDGTDAAEGGEQPSLESSGEVTPANPESIPSEPDSAAATEVTDTTEVNEAPPATSPEAVEIKANLPEDAQSPTPSQPVAEVNAAVAESLQQAGSEEPSADEPNAIKPAMVEGNKATEKPDVVLPPEVEQPPQLNSTPAEEAATETPTEADASDDEQVVEPKESAPATDGLSEVEVPAGKPTAHSLMRIGAARIGAGPRQASDDPPTEPKKVDVWMVALSIVVAAVCWGSYGPMLHIGQAKMSGSRLRPFTCVGLAYFFIAVAAPLYVIYQRSADTGSWTAGGMTWSFLAGVAGAIGALGVILAFTAAGNPYYVMPLIFGFAPVINTFISLTETGSWGRATTMFWVSLAVVIAGAVTVLTNAPKPKPKPKLEPVAAS